MSRKKEAALTGVLYYLLEEEEEKELVRAEEEHGFRSDARPWPLGARSLQSGMRRLIQSRRFLAPAGQRISGCGKPDLVPAHRHAEMRVKSQIMQLGITAERRNNSRRNRSNSGS